MISSVLASGLLIAGNAAAETQVKLGEDTYALLYLDVYASAVAGGDEDGAFARGVARGILNHTFSGDLQGGVNVAIQGYSAIDKDGDNLTDGSRGEIFTAVAYLTGKFGDLIAGKAYSAVSELVDIAPSAIGVNYGVNSPFLIHVENTRFSPRSASISPDFLERDDRVGFYTPDVDGFRLGVTYAPEIHDEFAETTNYVHWQNSVDVALVWKGNIGESAKLRLSVGYQQAQAQDNPASALFQTAGDPKTISVGGRIDWDGWQFSGGYSYYMDKYGLTDIDGESFQFGALYAWDRFKVSASYGSMEDIYPAYDATLGTPGIFYGNTGGDVEAQFVEVAASMKVTDYLEISAAGIQADYTDDYRYPFVVTNSVDNAGTYAVVQAHLSF